MQHAQKHLAFIAIIITVVAAIFVVQTKPIKEGLDLSGGVRFLLEAQTNDAVPKITPQVMDTLHSVLTKRVNPTGTEEVNVQKVGANRMLIEVPGETDIDSARSVIGKTGKLEFKPYDPEKGQYVSVGMTGADLTGAGYENGQKGWVVTLSFSPEGQKKFLDITRELSKFGGKLGIFFDDKLVSDPVVRQVIAGGGATIEGSFTRDEVKSMADILRAGSLPVDIKIIEESSVGPLLGKASLDKSIQGGLIGLAIVMAFMLVYYRAPGLFANVGLLIYTLLLIAALALTPSALTLSGVAGIILSIGMAVDANILIFERTKEEIAAGKTTDKAIELGFDRAFSSIFDSNMTTIMSSAVLYYFGSGMVKGFAFNLGLGVAISFVTAIFITRTLMNTFPIRGTNVALLFGVRAQSSDATA